MIKGLKLTDKKLSVEEMSTEDLSALVEIVRAFRGETEAYRRGDKINEETTFFTEPKEEVIIPTINVHVDDKTSVKNNDKKGFDTEIESKRFKAEPVPELASAYKDKSPSNFPVADLLKGAMDETKKKHTLGKWELPSIPCPKESGSAPNTEQGDEIPLEWKTGIKESDGGHKRYRTFYKCPTCNGKGKRYIHIDEKGSHRKTIDCYDCGQKLLVKPAVENKPGTGEKNRDGFGNYLVAFDAVNDVKQKARGGKY